MKSGLSTFRSKRLKQLVASTAALSLLVSAQAWANPSGGTVSAGNATIESQGSTLNVHQSTNKAVIDWQSFDIDVNEETRFYQPSSSSLTLNRVHSGSASQIMGKLSANGGVMVINQNGVLFGQQSVVDVGSLIVSTADISNNDFMAGQYNFNQAGAADAKIVNQGTITVKEAGLVGLVAPQIENSGVINARMGKVALASGDTYTMDMYGDNLINVSVSDDVAGQMIRHSGTINAQGGSVMMTAAAARDVVDSLIDVSGDIHANKINNVGGRILIQAAGANGTDKSGNSTVLVSGHLDASGDAQGGEIEVLGDQVAILNGATVDASGAASAGGTAHIGGEYLGGGDTQRAKATIVQSGATVKANGGDGEVILWSDEYTNFSGNIEANGDGGFVETSSKNLLLATGRVYAEGGEWLLDPTDITIRDDAGGGPDDTDIAGNPIFDGAGGGSVVTTEAIEAALLGADVTIRTDIAGGGNGDIGVDGAIEYTGATERTLTLEAYRNIRVNGTTIESTNGELNLVLNSRYTDGATGMVAFLSSYINTNGGDLLIAGGAGAAGNAIGSGDFSGWHGIDIWDSWVETGAGSVTMRGEGGADGTSGVSIYSNSLIATTSGVVDIFATSSTAHGFSMTSSSRVSTTTGDITITGNSTHATSYGINLAGGSDVLSTGAAIGDIIFNAASASSTDFVTAGATVNIGDMTTIDSQKNITINADEVTMANTAIATTGSVTFAPRTPGQNINLGGSTGGLDLSDAELAMISNNVDTFILGDSTAGTGLVTVDTWDFSGNSYDVELHGGSIVANGITPGTNALTLNGRTGFVRVTQDVIDFVSATVTAVTNIIFNADSDGNNSGNIDLSNSSLASTGGGIYLVGGLDGNADNIGDGYAYGVGANGTGINLNNTTITTTAGDMLMRGYGAPGGAGIIVTNGSLVTSTSGDIDAWAHGGDGAGGGYPVGMLLEGNSVISSTGAGINAGDIYINATAGDDTDGDSYGGFNQWDGGRISAVDGDIEIVGSGGNAVGINNSGIYLQTLGSGGAILETTGDGNITLTGTGSASAGATDSNYGILLESDFILRATGTGSISMTGTGGSNATGNNNSGLRIEGTVSATSGSITLDGTGGSGTANNYGINITGDLITTGGNIDLTGTGGTTSINSHGIIIDDALASITSTNGNITLVGEAGGTGGAGSDASGLIMNAGLIQTTGTGNIDITADSSNADGGDRNTGLRMVGGAQINATGAGNIDINADGGRGGAGHHTAMVMSGGTTAITANTGYIDISADAHANSLSAGTNGLYMDTGASITTSGSVAGQGNITITATGSAAAGGGNNGIWINNATLQTDAGALQITATGGDADANNYGLYLQAGTVNTTSGAIDIDGTGGNGTHNNYGIYLTADISSTSGNIDLNGTGDGSGTDNIGVFLDGSSVFTTTGNIIATGTADDGANSYGLQIDGGSYYTTGAGNIVLTAINATNEDFNANNATIGDGSAGNVTINTDEITLSGATTIDASGTVTIAPRTTAQAINLGAGVGGLDISDAEFAFISTNVGTVIIGDSLNGTGAVNIDTVDTSGRAYNLEVHGGQITVDNGLTGGGTVFLNARNSQNILLNSAITAVGGGNSLILNATGNFFNTAGAGALLPGAGRYLVYAANSTVSQKDFLAGDNIYSQTYGSLAPGAVPGIANTFIFANADPSVTPPPSGGGSNTPTLQNGMTIPDHYRFTVANTPKALQSSNASSGAPQSEAPNESQEDNVKEAAMDTSDTFIFDYDFPYIKFSPELMADVQGFYTHLKANF